MATTRSMTLEDLDELCDSESRFELIEGELLEMPPAGGEHGGLAFDLVERIVISQAGKPKLVQGFIAETGFILARDPDVVLVPDAAFVRIDRLPRREERAGRLELAPDIVVEVVSPSDRVADVTRKVMKYLQAGTQLVWVIDPASRTVTVYTDDRTARVLSEGDELDGGDLLPGFRVTVSELFG